MNVFLKFARKLNLINVRVHNNSWEGIGIKYLCILIWELIVLYLPDKLSLSDVTSLITKYKRIFALKVS